MRRVARQMARVLDYPLLSGSLTVITQKSRWQAPSAKTALSKYYFPVASHQLLRKFTHCYEKRAYRHLILVCRQTAPYSPAPDSDHVLIEPRPPELSGVPGLSLSQRATVSKYLPVYPVATIDVRWPT